jgi:biotin-dependent carboxylase-like uncharacterized protein
VITVNKPGISTVQDLGRLGQLGRGISWNGAADSFAARAANALVGNDVGAPLIEIVAMPFEMVASRDLELCVTGSPARVVMDGAVVDQWRVHRLPAGVNWRLDTIRDGLRSYVGIRGGIVAQEILGSCAPDAAVPIGGRLVAGDQLVIGGEPATRMIGEFVATSIVPRYGSPWTLDICLGPDAMAFAAPMDRLCEGEYLVRADSNHVGVRLDGAPLAVHSREEMLSRGVAVGAVEILPDGRPLILGRGHSVTAGYPVAAVVSRTQTDLLGQMRPGDRVRFRAIDLPSAIAAARSRALATAAYLDAN